MDDRLKQRLVGAAVLVLAAVIFVPMLLDEGDPGPQPGPRLVPAQPLDDGEARVVPLDGNSTAMDSASAPPAAARPREPDPAPPAGEPAEPPAVQPVSPPAPAVSAGFAVQLGSFSRAANAKGLRDKLQAKGYKAFVKSAGAVTRVYVGPQPSRAAAEQELARLLADTKLKGIVVEYSG